MNKIQTAKANIFYYDIGDYLSREEKLSIISNFRSVDNPAMQWKQITPNEHGDWLNQRNDVFSSFIPLAPEKKFDNNAQNFFSTYAIGVATNRDAWVYNYSNEQLTKNMRAMISFYNKQVDIFQKQEIELDNDPSKISWTVNLKKNIEKNITHTFDKNHIINSIYRPYCKQNLYFDNNFIERPGIHSKLFPTKEHKNLLICVTGIGSTKNFSALITNEIPCLDLVEKSQCFPLYYYEKKTSIQGELIEQAEDKYIRRDGVSDFILSRAKAQYDKNVGKEDIFYYVYGFLHSPDYRVKFANDLKKMLPRLPLVDSPKDFWAFSKAGRALAKLHLQYETVPPCPEVKISGAKSKQYKIEKMKFLAKDSKDTIIYNSTITIENIPAKAYQYVVNGKSAIEWIMERYALTTHKESGIKNDPNDWAKEHDKPRYILDLLLSVINVSVQTVDIVEKLPKLELD
jgi:predicted helicase